MKEFNWTPKEVQKNELVSPADLATIARYKQLEKEVAAINARIQSKMLETMREQGIKSIDNQYFKATYIAPSERKTVDSNKLKKDGLYDAYTKTTRVKESVRISWKELTE